MYSSDDDSSEDGVLDIYDRRTDELLELLQSPAIDDRFRQQINLELRERQHSETLTSALGFFRDEPRPASSSASVNAPFDLKVPDSVQVQSVPKTPLNSQISVGRTKNDAIVEDGCLAPKIGPTHLASEPSSASSSSSSEQAGESGIKHHGAPHGVPRSSVSNSSSSASLSRSGSTASTAKAVAVPGQIRKRPSTMEGAAMVKIDQEFAEEQPKGRDRSNSSIAAGAKAGGGGRFKPTPVAFDFVIGTSTAGRNSVKKQAMTQLTPFGVNKPKEKARPSNVSAAAPKRKEGKATSSLVMADKREQRIRPQQQQRTVHSSIKERRTNPSLKDFFKDSTPARGHEKFDLTPTKLGSPVSRRSESGSVPNKIRSRPVSRAGIAIEENVNSILGMADGGDRDPLGQNPLIQDIAFNFTMTETEQARLRRELQSPLPRARPQSRAYSQTDISHESLPPEQEFPDASIQANGFQTYVMQHHSAQRTLSDARFLDQSLLSETSPEKPHKVVVEYTPDLLDFDVLEARMAREPDESTELPTTVVVNYEDESEQLESEHTQEVESSHRLLGHPDSEQYGVYRDAEQPNEENNSMDRTVDSVDRAAETTAAQIETEEILAITPNEARPRFRIPDEDLVWVPQSDQRIPNLTELESTIRSRQASEVKILPEESFLETIQTPERRPNDVQSVSNGMSAVEPSRNVSQAGENSFGTNPCKALSLEEPAEEARTSIVHVGVLEDSPVKEEIEKDSDAPVSEEEDEFSPTKNIVLKYANTGGAPAAEAAHEEYLEELERPLSVHQQRDAFKDRKDRIMELIKKEKNSNAPPPPVRVATAAAPVSEVKPPASIKEIDKSVLKSAAHLFKTRNPNATLPSNVERLINGPKAKSLRPGETAGGSSSSRAGTRGIPGMAIDPLHFSEEEIKAIPTDLGADYESTLHAIFSQYHFKQVELQAKPNERHNKADTEEITRLAREFCEILKEFCARHVSAGGEGGGAGYTGGKLQRSQVLDVFLGGIDRGGPSSNATSVPSQIPPNLRSNFAVRYYKVIENRQEVYDIVTRALNRKTTWEEFPHGLGAASNFLWNLLWTWSQPKIDFSKLLVWQKVNHFPGNKHLTRKDRLKRNIERYTKQSNHAIAALFRIMPQTFILPKEYVTFCQVYGTIEEKAQAEEQAAEEAAAAAAAGGTPNTPNAPGDPGELRGTDRPKSSSENRTKRRNYWIMKPAKSSRGRGIYVLNDIGDVSYGELTVIQQYIHNPLLLEGYKWDLRLYVLVNSFQPNLEAYVYKEGFARFATVPYTLNDLRNVIHLTNTSIQRHNEMNMKQTKETVIGGTKIDLKTLAAKLAKINISFDLLWSKMIDCILKSLLVAGDHMVYNPNAFEIFGYDLIFDRSLNCWLIEVNSSPSLGVDTLLDEQVKIPMVDDTIELVDPVPFNRERLCQVLSRRNSRSKNANQQLTIDLAAILGPDYGRKPKNLGNYQQIAPSEQYNHILKLKSQLFK